jgi:Kef-type K+ transport system membrane component KefB
MLDVQAAEVLSLFELIKEPLFEILISIGLGGAIGFASGFAIRTISNNRDRKEKNLNIIVISVFLTTGTALFLGASPILTPMIAGTVVTNMINKECYVLEEETIRFFVPPIMIAFFTIAGAQLQFDVIIAAGMVGVVYIVGRIFGKMIGAYIGTTIVKSSSSVKKYLGISLLPQSGVAIGLSVAAYNELSVVAGPEALVIKNVILASVLFFALTGPVLVKIAFGKAGELEEEVKEEKVISWKNSHAYQE